MKQCDFKTFIYVLNNEVASMSQKFYIRLTNCKII